jgi:transposase
VLKAQIMEFDRMIIAWHRSNETSKRLDEIPGVGPALATALVASIADPKAFRSGRDFSLPHHYAPNRHDTGSTTARSVDEVALIRGTLKSTMRLC